MKIKAQFLKSIAIIVTTIIMITLMIIGISAITTDDTAKIPEENTDCLNQNCFMNASTEAVYLITDVEYFSNNATVTLPFKTKISSERQIKNILYETNGFSVISYSIENEIIYVTIQHEMDIECPNLTLKLLLDNDTELSACLYGCLYENNVFISGLSKDDAFEKYCSFLLENNRINTDQYYKMINTYYKQFVELNINYEENIELSSMQGTAQTMAISRDTYVEGTIYWGENSIAYPCQYVKVEIYDEQIFGDDLLGTVYTDKNGEFSFTFENSAGFLVGNGADIYIVVYAQGERVVVKNQKGDIYSFNTIDDVRDNVATGSTTTFSLIVNMSSDMGQAFQISQPAIIASNYVKAMKGSYLPSVDVKFPIEGENCYYSSNTQTIYMLRSKEEHTGPVPTYGSWDVVMHEYGHHVQHHMGITDSPGGTHYLRTNCIDYDYAKLLDDFTENQRKELGVKLAWGEGWPTAFAIMAQEYYKDDLLGIPTVGDTLYTAYNISGFDLENDLHYAGEGSECSIMGFLYDLYDMYDPDESEYDKVQLGHQLIWNYVMNSQAVTFWGFIQYLNDEELLSIDKLGLLLSNFGMAVIPIGITAIDTRYLPTFMWAGNGGSDLRPYDNYTIVFATDEGELFRRSSTDFRHYELTIEEWEQILATNSPQVKWRVLAGGTQDYVTGPYSSAWEAFELPATTELSLNTPISDSIINSGDYVWYKFTAPKSGGYSFYTEGNADTIGELFPSLVYNMNTTNCYAYCDDGINANFNIGYYLEEGQTVYLRISVYSTFTGEYTLYVTENDYL